MAANAAIGMKMQFRELATVGWRGVALLALLVAALLALARASGV